MYYGCLILNWLIFSSCSLQFVLITPAVIWITSEHWLFFFLSFSCQLSEQFCFNDPLSFRLLCKHCITYLYEVLMSFPHCSFTIVLRHPLCLILAVIFSFFFIDGKRGSFLLNACIYVLVIIWSLVRRNCVCFFQIHTV